jgi:hypothetical protein
MESRSRLSTWKLRLGLSLIVIALCLVSLELALAWIGLAPPPVADPAEFFRFDAALGWSHRPDFVGVFSVGGLENRVTLDSHGFRANAPGGTRVPGYRNVFMIGDSTTASFEVADAETVPAQVEALLRSEGARVNVLNLGVRGYGTDQAVALALRHGEEFRPTDIIYTYTDNDVFSNNLISNPATPYSKSVWIRRTGSEQFAEYGGGPVPQRRPSFAGLVVFDEACRPFTRELELQRGRFAAGSTERFLRERSHLVRALDLLAVRLRKAIGSSDGPEGSLEPHALVERGVRWSLDFEPAYYDGGALRSRCRAYFDAQLAFLLGRLRSLPSVERVHVVQWPSASSIVARGSGATGRPRPSAEAFRTMLAEGKIDGWIDLVEVGARSGIEFHEFRRSGDTHYGRRGNRWIAEQVVRQLDWSAPSEG